MIYQYDTTFNSKNIDVFTEIFKKGEIAIGDYQKILQKKVGELTDCKYVFLTSSGTSALHISLLALETKNNEVITSSYLCQEVLNAINYSGSKPIFVDINSSNYSMSISETIKSISNKTAAVIVPYIYGDVISISELKEKQIPIIEDLAHCIGAKINGKKVGSLGTIGMTSFGNRKFLDGGYGGAIFTNDSELATKIENLLFPTNSENYKINFNYLLPNIFAAIICEKISVLDKQISNRKKIAQYYIENFQNTNIQFRYQSSNDSFFYRFMLDIHKNKKKFINEMASKGVVCGVGVDYPLHTMIKQTNQLFPNTDFASSNSIALPIRPNLNQNELDHIIRSTKVSMYA